MKFGQVNSGDDLADAVQFSKQYVALADMTITNSTSELSALSGTFAGTGKTITANKLNQGSVIRIRGGGVYSTPLAITGTITIRVKLGNTVVASTIISSLVGNLSSEPFAFNCALIVRSIGASGVVAPLGSIELNTGITSQLKANGSVVSREHHKDY